MRRIALPAFALLFCAGGCVSAAKHKEELARSANLESEKKDLLSKKADLETALKTANQELASMKEADTQLKGKHDYTTTKLADTEENLKKVRENLAAVHNELADEKKAGRELLGKHEFTKAKLTDTEAKTDKLRQRLESLRGEFSGYKRARDQERSELQANWKTVQQNIQTLDAKLKEVNRFYEEINKQMTALQTLEKPGTAVGESVLAAEEARAAMEDDIAAPAPKTATGVAPVGNTTGE